MTTLTIKKNRDALSSTEEPPSLVDKRKGFVINSQKEIWRDGWRNGQTKTLSGKRFQHLFVQKLVLQMYSTQDYLVSKQPL